MNQPAISIIIPAKNAKDTIKKCLDSVSNLNYADYETIVVNDGSTDETEAILKSYPHIKVIGTQSQGPSRARNLGIEKAIGDMAAFTDADCMVHPEWLNELLKCFTDPKIAGVGGVQKNPGDDSPFGQRVQDFFNLIGFIPGYTRLEKNIKQVNHTPSCNAMYRRSVLVELGGFLPGLWPGEDVELDYRIKKKGYKLVFNPKAIVFHYRVKSSRDFNTMMFKYGKAQGWLVRKYGLFRLMHLIPIFTLIILFLLFYNAFLGITLILSGALFIFIKSSLQSYPPFLMSRFLFTTIFVWNAGFMQGVLKKEFN